MVKKIILSFCLILSGCGFYPEGGGFIDPEFLPYVQEYKADKQKILGTSQIRKMPITFKILDGDDGRCEVISFQNRLTKQTVVSYKYIYIDSRVWPVLSPTERKILIYHELGHCDLGLKHSKENTIMNPYAISEHLFNTNPDYYINLLFIEGK